MSKLKEKKPNEGNLTAALAKLSSADTCLSHINGICRSDGYLRRNYSPETHEAIGTLLYVFLDAVSVAEQEYDRLKADSEEMEVSHE